jgi:hypothetical protein
MSTQSNSERFHELVKRNLLGIAVGGLCLFSGVKVITTITEARATPIVDQPCQNAADVAAIVCGTPKLLALKDEMAKDAMRSANLYRFNRGAQAELQNMVPQFVGMRDQAAGIDGVGLEPIMQYQRDFWAALDAPRKGNSGVWINAFGTLTITETAQGIILQLSAAEPARKEWRCELKINASQEWFELRAIDGTAKKPMNGWDVRVRRDGALLRLEEIAPADSNGERPYCKNGGGLGGLYFPAR